MDESRRLMPGTNTQLLETEARKRSKKPDRVRIGRQIVRPIELEEMSPRVRELVLSNRLQFVTRNSSCPCGSGKRFKRCCMVA